MNTSELTKKAILVEFSVSIFPNTRDDKQITSDTLKSHSLKANAGKWKRNKLDPRSLDAIQNISNWARNHIHYKYTVPWQNRGPRLLPAALHDLYEKDMEKAKADFQKKVDAWISKYPDLVAEAKTMHNGTFDHKDYPGYDPATGLVASPSPAKACFSFTVEPSPVPDSSHIVLQLAGDKIERMRESFDKLSEARIKESVAHTWGRLLEPVKHLADTLSKDKPVFKQSLVGNIHEITAIMDGLNVTGDPVMAEAARQIEEIFKDLDSEALKDSPLLQTEVIKKTSSVMATFGRYGRKMLA